MARPPNEMRIRLRAITLVPAQTYVSLIVISDPRPRRARDGLAVGCMRRLGGAKHRRRRSYPDPTAADHRRSTPPTPAVRAAAVEGHPIIASDEPQPYRTSTRRETVLRDIALPSG